MTTFQIYGSSS